jgi:hypothetical protein
VRTRTQGPEVQSTQPVGASSGEKASIGASSDAKGMRRCRAEVKAKGPEVQSTQRVGASNAELVNPNPKRVGGEARERCKGICKGPGP